MEPIYRLQKEQGIVKCTNLFNLDLLRKVKEQIPINSQFQKVNVGNKPYFNQSEMAKVYWVRAKDSELSQVIFSYMQKVVNLIEHIYEVQIEKDLGYNITTYQKGEGYKLHIDRSYNDAFFAQRDIGIVVGLTSEYSGGELVFPKQNYSTKVTENDIVFFPAYFTHPHEVTKVESGVRSVIVCWVKLK